MIKVKKTKMTGKALLLMNDGCLIAYKKGQLVVYKNEELIKHINLPAKLWKRTACKIRLIERMLHTDVRWAVDLSDQEILFLFQNVIYKVNLATEKIEKDFFGFRGQPFSFTRVGEKLIFGDYGSNDKRESVNIYERKDGKWSVAYKFPAGTIRHIHNILCNKNGFYILTGDENDESGIWKANSDFSSVEPLLIGKQQYRCCQMVTNEEDSGWYITDAPSEANGIYSFADKEIKMIHSVPGTVIYGTQERNKLVFSTTVEPEAHAKNKLDYWLSNKPGSGIINSETKVFLLRDGRMKELASFEHDGKPLRLFQYATVQFSNIIDGLCFFTPISVKKVDNCILELNID